MRVSLTVFLSSNTTLNATFLCVEQQVLYGCNASGWYPYFDLFSGQPGQNAFTTTMNSFVQPDCGQTVMVHVGSTAWMAVGQVIFIQVHTPAPPPFRRSA